MSFPNITIPLKFKIDDEKENISESEDRVEVYAKLAKIKFNLLSQMTIFDYINHIDIANELENDILDLLDKIWEEKNKKCT